MTDLQSFTLMMASAQVVETSVNTNKVLLRTTLQTRTITQTTTLTHLGSNLSLLYRHNVMTSKKTWSAESSTHYDDSELNINCFIMYNPTLFQLKKIPMLTLLIEVLLCIKTILLKTLGFFFIKCCSIRAYRKSNA